MMAGPWHCTRLSWLTLWPCRKLRSISRKAATAFLSILSSASCQEGDKGMSRVSWGQEAAPL